MKRDRFFWQPELAIAITYWSFVLLVFFCSLILSLENTHPYFWSNLVLAVSIVLFLLGLHRYFRIEGEALVIRYMIPFRNKRILLADVKEIMSFRNGIRLQIAQGREVRSMSFIMTKKQQQRFLSAVEQAADIMIKQDKTVKFSRD